MTTLAGTRNNEYVVLVPAFCMQKSVSYFLFCVGIIAYIIKIFPYCVCVKELSKTIYGNTTIGQPCLDVRNDERGEIIVVLQYW